ncbi:MAG: DUF2029 domain-containing protein [Chloroflexia bacterium]|nr:DUF2029 domain-containing protein [Chloroflexia bacterium]
MTAPRGPGKKWLNLALLAAACLYVLFTLGSLLGRGLFETVGGDYRAFRSSAQIATQVGFAQVYDLDLQEQYQRALYDAYARIPVLYMTVPAPLLPPFILIFVPLLLLPPLPGLIAWTVLQVLLLWLYLRRFLGALEGFEERGVFALLLCSFPLFWNLLFGQINLFLLIFVGEFLLAYLRGREIVSGLWLGGLLLKPQALILLLPGLLLRRSFKALAGFGLAGLAVLGLSLLLGGPEGLIALGRLILGYAEGLQTNVPQFMVNWRALALNLGELIPAPIAWGVAIAGMLLTAGVALAFWLRPRQSSPTQFGLVLLGTYAATCAVTWHSHIQMTLPLVVLLLFLESRGQVDRRLLIAWALVPAAVYFAALLPLPAIPQRLTGFSMLVLNLYLVYRAARQLWSAEPERGAGLAEGWTY